MYPQCSQKKFSPSENGLRVCSHKAVVRHDTCTLLNHSSGSTEWDLDHHKIL